MKLARIRPGVGFGAAFAAAREAGADVFEYEGGRYNTRREDDPPAKEEPIILELIETVG